MSRRGLGACRRLGDRSGKASRAPLRVWWGSQLRDNRSGVIQLDRHLDDNEWIIMGSSSFDGKTVDRQISVGHCLPGDRTGKFNRESGAESGHESGLDEVGDN